MGNVFLRNLLRPAVVTDGAVNSEGFYGPHILDNGCFHWSKFCYCILYELWIDEYYSHIILYNNKLLKVCSTDGKCLAAIVTSHDQLPPLHVL